MNFNAHSNLDGRHAVLSPSNYYWLKYDDDKLYTTYLNMLAKEHGTELHDFAAQCIRLNQKLPKSTKTLNRYVNDAIGFKMTPEQALYYSPNCFGHADTICYRDDILRIHDYKSGQVPAHMEQLRIYAALFCLEYGITPFDISEINLRIYQSDDVVYELADPNEISEIMDIIVKFDTIINNLKEGTR